MRILTIVKHLRPGGTPRAAQTRSIAYKERGHDVAVFATMFGGRREAAIREAGVDLIIGDHEDPAAHERAIDAAIDWAPEVVHIHRTGHTDHDDAALLKRLKAATQGRLPVIEINHFARVDYSPERDLIDVHTQLSRWCLWKFRQWCRGLDPQPIAAVAPCFISTAAFFPAGAEAGRAFRAEHGIPEDAFVFGRLGQAYKVKWHPSIFAAFTRIAKERPEAYLLLIGAPEAYDAIIAKLPEDVRRRVIQPPFLHGDEKLRACYAAMDVFLHAAKIGESFGQVLGEAMLCEVPIISLSRPYKDNSQLEVVGHERGGLIVNDVASMCEAMRILMGDAPLREKLARQGSAFVRENFDVPHLAAHMLHITKLVMENDTRGSIRKALEEDETVITDVSWDECRALLGKSIGRPSPWDLQFLKLIQTPWLYRRFGFRASS